MLEALLSLPYAYYSCNFFSLVCLFPWAPLLGWFHIRKPSGRYKP